MKKLVIIFALFSMLAGKASVTDTVKLYHPQANAASDIQAAVQQAKKEGKHVLLQAGGNWCSWCIRFHKFVTEDKQMDSVLNANYIVYHLNYSPDNLNNAAATVSVRFKWVNQNPFRSLYFAVLSMAAELSTGVQAFAQVYGRKPSISMLVVKMNAEFYKKAVGTIRFTCTDGVLIEEAIEKSIATKEGVTVDCTSEGINEAQEVVARFNFTWSFKAKS